MLVILAATGCADDGYCDALELRGALSRAYTGDQIRVGVCRVSGSFTVPAGVTLRGAGTDQSILASEGTDPVVRLQPGELPSVVTDLSIEN